MSNSFRMYVGDRSDSTESNRFITVKTTLNNFGSTGPPPPANESNLGRIYINTQGKPFICTVFNQFLQPSYLRCLTSDGNGGIYIGAENIICGVTTISSVAYYNTNTGVISSLDGGIDGIVYAIAVSSNGMVYIGGDFTDKGNRIAMWNPNTSTWSTLGTGVNDIVYAIAISSTGLVYVGGKFTDKGSKIAVWDPNALSWSALDTGVNNTVLTIAIAPNHTVYAGGLLTDKGNRVASWDGITWSALGVGLSAQCNSLVYSNNILYAAGLFTQAGGNTVDNIAKWDGAAWSNVGTTGTGLLQTTNSRGDTLAVDSLGNIYLGGLFSIVDGVVANGLARWNGTKWEGIFGTGLTETFAVCPLAPDKVYAGGIFRTGSSNGTIGFWNGYLWNEVLPTNIPYNYAWVQMSQGCDVEIS